MTFRLNGVVPWGRSFEEYRRMFSLTEEDLRKGILGVGDGPAGFNSEATWRGTRVVSCDPLYQFDTDRIGSRIKATFAEVLEQTEQNRQSFVWDTIRSLEELGRIRGEAMNRFLGDFEGGKRDGRYVPAELPRLPFRDDAFGLALCSHFLFLYSDHFNEDFHLEAIEEMCRVAGETRVFPVLTLGGDRSPYLEGVQSGLVGRGLEPTIETVQYEFQRGGKEMLRVRKRSRLPD